MHQVLQMERLRWLSIGRRQERNKELSTERLEVQMVSRIQLTTRSTEHTRMGRVTCSSGSSSSSHGGSHGRPRPRTCNGKLLKRSKLRLPRSHRTIAGRHRCIAGVGRTIAGRRRHIAECQQDASRSYPSASAGSRGLISICGSGVSIIEKGLPVWELFRAP